MYMKRISYIMILLAAGVFIACGDDDEPELNIDDAELVSNSITIDNAVKMEGNLPAPSSDPDAPSLYDNSNEDFGVVSGKSFYLDPDVKQGQPAGIYFQIKGSNEYFDIPLTPGSSGGRFGSRKPKSILFKNARTDKSYVIEIQIPDNLEPGEFCALYCIYDEEERVSNVVEICIEVIEFGGDGSEFFSGQTWEMVSTKYSEGGVIEIEVPGEDYIENYETWVLCADNTYQPVTLAETYRTNYLYLTFSDNGAYELETEYYVKEFDSGNSTCDNLKYTEGTELYKETGVWTYDNVSKMLTVVTELVEDDGQKYTDIFKLRIELVNNQLVLSDKEDGEDYEVVLKKKN